LKIIKSADGMYQTQIIFDVWIDNYHKTMYNESNSGKSIVTILENLWKNIYCFVFY
jgi:hypothetical protein